MSGRITSSLKRVVKTIAVCAVLAFAFAGSEAAATKTCDAAGTTCFHHFKPERGGFMLYHVTFCCASPISVINVRTRSGQQVEIPLHSRSLLGAVSKTARWNGIKPGFKYTVSIQACYKRFAGSSSCSSWRQVTFKA